MNIGGTEPEYPDAYLAMFTNSMPDHCYYTLANAPLGTDKATGPDTFNSYAFFMRWNTPIADMARFEL